MNGQYLFWAIILSIITSFMCCIMSYYLIQHLQLSGYKVKNYFIKIKKSTLIECVLCGVIAWAALFGIYLLINAFWKPLVTLSYFAFIAAVATYAILFIKRRPKKTPLRFTYRIKRFYAIYGLIMFLVSFSLCYIGKSNIAGLSLGGASAILCYPAVGLSAVITKPIEKLFYNKFVFLAKSKLVKSKNLTIIGITGSCGKTSVKFILRDMLSSKYKVCATPGSYNTPMGVCRAINENLKQDDQIFIVEMGARKKGDIEKICEIAKPDISVITAVEPQHLETFKTLKNIAAAKYEIVENMKEGGTVFFNGDSQNVLDLYRKCPHPKVMTGQLGEEHGISEEYLLSYTDINVTDEGSEFSLMYGGMAIQCSTRLLGKHNISNITLAAAVALKLGIGIDDIKAAINSLMPVRHRLELIKTPAMTIIDDTFNANIKGATEALEVLGKFQKTKVVITAGLVEMGKSSAACNKDLGQIIASKADWCILVGPNSTHIYDGLICGGMDISRILLASSLDNAVKQLKLIKGDKAVLFQNDLPDNF